jgi:hypothetical protein
MKSTSGCAVSLEAGSLNTMPFHKTPADTGATTRVACGMTQRAFVWPVSDICRCALRWQLFSNSQSAKRLS